MTPAKPVDIDDKRPVYIDDQEWSNCVDFDNPIRHLAVAHVPVTDPGGSGGQPQANPWTSLKRDFVLQGSWPTGGQHIPLHRLVFTSDAGGGKSEALCWLWRQWNRPEAGRLAILLTADEFEESSLKDRTGAAFATALVKRLAEKLALPSKGKVDSSQHAEVEQVCLRLVERSRATGRLALLLDGLDQAPEHPAWLREILESPYWHNCPIVVAGRQYAIMNNHERFQRSVDPRDRRLTWQFIRLEPFTSAQITRYLDLGKDGRPTYDSLSSSVQKILPIPRILKYLRTSVSPEKWTSLQSAAEVFEEALNEILNYGMANSAEVRKLFHTGPEDQTSQPVVALHKQLLWELLGCVAYTMTFHSRFKIDAAMRMQIPQLNFIGVTPGGFPEFAKRLETVYKSPSTGFLDRAWLALAALGVPLKQGLFENSGKVKGLNQILFADRSLQEFLTARYLAQHAEKQHAEVLGGYICRADRLPETAQTYWIWQFLCEMPVSVLDEREHHWLTAIEPLYQRSEPLASPGRRAGLFRTLLTRITRWLGRADSFPPAMQTVNRSTEMIFRSWPRLTVLCQDPLVGDLARGIRDHWLGEFEAIVKGEQGPDRQRAAREFQGDFLTIPAGKVTMGNPTGRRIPSADGLDVWRGLFNHMIEADSEQWIEQWITSQDVNGFFGRGPSRDAQIAGFRQLWTSALIEHQTNGSGFAVIENALFGEENETWLADLPVASFDFGRSPVLNEWYRLFVPDHGLAPTPWAEEYKDYSGTPRHPAIYISFYDAWAFCLWVHFAGASCRLPWEREWEYVAKLGVKPDWHYWWHESRFDDNKANAFQKKRKPATSPPSPDHASPATKALDTSGRGIMDLLGNVWEWCQDRYEVTAWKNREGSPGNPSDVTKHPDMSRVLRGGSFNNLVPVNCRASIRIHGHPSIIDYNGGFRAARACSPR